MTDTTTTTTPHAPATAAPSMPVLLPWYLDAAATPFSPYVRVPVAHYRTLDAAIAGVARVRSLYRYYAVRVRAA